jgi:hypothetical protein
MVAFTAVVTVASVLLVGLIPALTAARSDLMAAIRGEAGSGSRGRIRLPGRRLLVSAQVAMTLVLLVAAGLLVTTLRNLIDADLGFDRQLLQIEIDGVRAGYKEGRLLGLAQQLTTSMRALRGVAGVSVSNNGLLSNDEMTAPVMVLGDRARSEDERLANFNQVSEGYFRTLGVPVAAGREFTEGDRRGAPGVAIINASMARYYFGEANAIGRQFRVGDDASAPVVTIVGVVKDIKNKGPRETPDRRFYASYFQAEDHTPGLRFQLRLSGPPEVVAPMVRAAIRRIDATLGIRSMGSVETTYRRLLVRDRLMANLAAAFGVLAALLTPFDPAILGTSVLVLLAVATCAAYLPARHATRVDPLVALRSDWVLISHRQASGRRVIAVSPSRRGRQPFPAACNARAPCAVSKSTSLWPLILLTGKHGDGRIADDPRALAWDNSRIRPSSCGPSGGLVGWRGSDVAEVTRRKRPAGAGPQVFLEPHRSMLGRKFQHHHPRPWPMPHGVAARTTVVPLESSLGVRGDSHVVALRVRVAAEDVDEALACSFHGVERCKARTRWTPPFDSESRLDPTRVRRSCDSGFKSSGRNVRLRGGPAGSSPPAASARQPSPVSEFADARGRELTLACLPSRSSRAA